MDRGWPDAAPAIASGNRAARRRGEQNLKSDSCGPVAVIYGYCDAGTLLSMDNIATIGPHSSILSDQSLL
jgi:hypothetical protein